MHIVSVLVSDRLFNDTSFDSVIEYGQVLIDSFPREVGDQFHESAMAYAAFTGNLRDMETLYEAGYEIDVWSIRAAANKSLAVVQWMESLGYAVDLNDALSGESLEVVKYLYHSEPVYELEYGYSAASSKNPEILRWLLEETNLPVHEVTFQAAVDSIEKMEALLKAGCKFHANTFAEAVEIDNRDSAEWLHEHGCPTSPWAYLYAAINDNKEMFDWLQGIGCPFDGWAAQRILSRRRLEHSEWFEALK